MLNDSSFVSEIFVNTNEVADSQPLSYTRELLSSSEIMLSLKTETTLQHF